MDGVTQGLLGAAIGQAGFAQKLGRRAILWGAVAGVVPDLDVLASIPFGTWGEFLYHRSLTHSLWFGPVVGPLLGWALWRRHGRAPGLLHSWIGLCVLALFTHPLLDLFTTYGTQLLWPFSTRRFAIDAVAIVDPGYSLFLLGGLLIGRRAKEQPRFAARAAAAALALSTAYLGFGSFLDVRSVAQARQELAAEGVSAVELRCCPTLLQPFLRRCIASAPGELRVGYLSQWSRHPISWSRYEPPQHPAVERLRQSWEGRVFEWFAMGWTAPHVRQENGFTVVEIDDLRYGHPGTADLGLWGIRAEFAADGSLRRPVERYHRPLPASVGELLRQMGQMTFAPYRAVTLASALPPT